jgi:hypothetical protein
MTWSYSEDPASSDRDQVRFYCGDTNEQLQLLTDEEIDFLLAQWESAFNSALYVAAVACEVLATKFATLVNVSADGVTVDFGSLSQKYNDLAASLRDQYKALYGNEGPLVASDMANAGPDDPTIPPLIFGVGWTDNFLAGRQNYGDRGDNRQDEEFVIG